MPVFIKLMFYCVGTGNTQISNLYIILKVIRVLNKVGREREENWRERKRRRREREEREREGNRE